MSVFWLKKKEVNKTRLIGWIRVVLYGGLRASCITLESDSDLIALSCIYRE